jgi:hypothetical protein
MICKNSYNKSIKFIYAVLIIIFVGLFFVLLIIVNIKKRDNHEVVIKNSKKITAYTNAWEGSWVRKDSVDNDYSKLSITNVTDTTFDFNLVVVGNHGHDGEISYIGKNTNREPFVKRANIENNIATFILSSTDGGVSSSISGKPCKLIFTQLKKDWLHVDESDCEAYRGNGIYFNGDYERGAAIAQLTTVNSIKFNKEFCDTIANQKISEVIKVGDGVTYTLPDSCIILIGNGVSYRFSFETIPSDFPNKELAFTLKVYNSSNGTLVQSIDLDYDSSFNNLTINLHDDVNADGYKDMLVRVLSPRAAEFTYFIYNPAKNMFEEDTVLSNIFTPSFDKQNMKISSTPDIPNYYADENGEQQYYTPEEQTTVFTFKNGKYYQQE